MNEPGRRSPWVAGMWSALGPGLGQLYNGQAMKALVVFAAYWAVPLFGLLVLLRSGASPAQFLKIGLAIAVLYVAAAVDAVIDTRRLAAFPRPWYARWWACLAAYLLLAVIVVPVAMAVAVRTVAQAFTLPTGGMEPTLLRGDYLIADKTTYGWRVPLVDKPLFTPRTPERLDIAVFRFPGDRSKMFVQRVVGLPGDTVEVRDGRAIVNGRPLDEPYVAERMVDTETAADEWGPETVPAGQYFMLGDNRQNSRDSRYFGWVPGEDVTARIAFLYFSLEPSRVTGPGAPSGRIRWDRMGHVPR